MTRRDRKYLGRIREGRCLRHNLPIQQSDYFDGGTCPAGCVSLNTVREAIGMRILRERRWRRGQP